MPKDYAMSGNDLGSLLVIGDGFKYPIINWFHRATYNDNINLIIINKKNSIIFSFSNLGYPEIFIEGKIFFCSNST